MKISDAIKMLEGYAAAGDTHVIIGLWDKEDVENNNNTVIADADWPNLSDAIEDDISWSDINEQIAEDIAEYNSGE